MAYSFHIAILLFIILLILFAFGVGLDCGKLAHYYDMFFGPAHSVDDHEVPSLCSQILRK
jgi:hypothetical protein